MRHAPSSKNGNYTVRIGGLNFVQKLLLDLSGLRLIPLVEYPLLDALAADQARLLQDFEMLAGSRLADAWLARDQQAADAVLDWPHVRRTPVIAVDGADFRMNSISLIFGTL